MSETEVKVVVAVHSEKKNSVRYQEKGSISPFPFSVYVPKVVLEQLGVSLMEDLEIVFRKVD